MSKNSQNHSGLAIYAEIVATAKRGKEYKLRPITQKEIADELRSANGISKFEKIISEYPNRVKVELKVSVDGEDIDFGKYWHAYTGEILCGRDYKKALEGE